MSLGIDEVGAMRLRRRSAALRAEPATLSQAKPPAAIAGPSERFIKLTRNPDAPRPARFEPTLKGENDVVI